MKVGDKLTVEIEKLTFGGAGLARHEGRVIFIPFAAPKDKLLIEITESKKSFLNAKIIEILEPSPIRQTPPCSIFYKCGGCNWQHLNYQSQLEAKQIIFTEIWERQLKGSSAEITPIEPSPSAWNYRNRIQIKSHKNKTGFYARGTHEIINMNECKIAAPEINTFYSEWLKTKPQSDDLQLFNFKMDSKNKVHLKTLQTDEEPIGFSQVNTLQNQKLIDWVIRAYEMHPQPHILDLYGGPGNFAIPLSKKFPKVQSECVEFNFNAYKEGLRLQEELKLNNLKMIQGDVELYLKRSGPLEHSFVIIDPPREGCSSNVMNYLLSLKPKALVYISCDPMTWARDAKMLKQNYRSAWVQPIDMFPQTDHIEVFSLWLRES